MYINPQDKNEEWRSDHHACANADAAGAEAIKKPRFRGFQTTDKPPQVYGTAQI
jgi:hypothetical protein